MPQTVTLKGPSPWGFRLVGGRDFSTPLTVSRVTAGSKAAQGDLCPGDTILTINGDSTEQMTHMEAQNRIKTCTQQLTLSISRSGSGDRVWSPTVSEDGKTSPYTEPDSQNFRPITSGYGGYSRKPSYTPEPQSPQPTHPTQPTQPTQPTHMNNGHSRPNNGHSHGYGNGTGHAQYNNPTGLYGGSNGDRCLPSKMGGLSLSATHSPEPPAQSPVGGNGFNPQSDVYKMLQDYEEPASEPKQSGSFKYLQGILEAEDGGVSPTERMRNLKSPVRSPIPKLGSPIPSPMSGLQKLPQCTRCCNGIVGTIVKARDKLYHPECFMCDDCGLNLKQRGYFFIEDNLYCETHAKARVQPPEGYDVVAVYPNSKVELV
ncbi:putative PDZ and LIM domain protein 4-like [Scophthalmus maximus]|uniref:PDZ and LIM domain protein 4 n=1 Tax=Scophthalmus maximus TaxID=52904 RepID=A0A2U9B7R1_SCOMX|nr:PDZ and LIM domain protein 4 isoform X1 [Scophthalmus maximus]AWP00001.1 putative PDZ and LIM domain protein 4-like [Scophthalmus maximus]